MESIFIQEINIKKVRHLTNITIPISQIEKKHLLLTGKNGSGKTSLLAEISKFFISPLPLNPILNQFSKNISFQVSGNINSNFNFKTGDFILTYFDSKRITNLKIPNGINKINIKNYYEINERANIDFIQYIVNLKADRSFSRDDNDTTAVIEIDNWFKLFEESLQTIFDDVDLKLEFDKKNYNFNIVQSGKEPFNLNTLSDGYSQFLNIITELIIRMENKSSRAYKMEGIVLIDEIETHLHIDLQKKVLPFLTKFFPNIQFIVTTHSPFVLSSIDNAVIYDLENKLLVEDLTGYSVDGIIESYFNSDKYSEELKIKVSEYESLMSNKNINETEKERLHFLKNYFNELPKFMSPELQVKLQQIELLNYKK